MNRRASLMLLPVLFMGTQVLGKGRKIDISSKEIEVSLKCNLLKEIELLDMSKKSKIKRLITKIQQLRTAGFSAESNVWLEQRVNLLNEALKKAQEAALAQQPTPQPPCTGCKQAETISVQQETQEAVQPALLVIAESQLINEETATPTQEQPVEIELAVGAPEAVAAIPELTEQASENS